MNSLFIVLSIVSGIYLAIGVYHAAVTAIVFEENKKKLKKMKIFFTTSLFFTIVFCWPGYIKECKKHIAKLA